jgi:transketolase N-terminal domain/subunit
MVFATFAPQFKLKNMTIINQNIKNGLVYTSEEAFRQNLHNQYLSLGCSVESIQGSATSHVETEIKANNRKMTGEANGKKKKH